MTEEEIKRATVGMLARVREDLQAGRITIEETFRRFEQIYGWREDRLETAGMKVNA